MSTKYFSIPFLLIIGACLFCSCQKEIDGLIVNSGGGSGGGGGIPANMKPKVGTKWRYRYSTYNAGGGIIQTSNVTYKANSEDLLGGEKWLNIIDSATGVTIYFLNQKTGGLYHYANNSSYLLCKYPAALLDTFTTYNGTETVNFIVQAVNDTFSFGTIGNLAINYYEGFLLANMFDKIWYNDNVWIAARNTYRKRQFGNFHYLSATLIIQSIVF